MENDHLHTLRQLIYDMLNDLEVVFNRPHEKGDLCQILFFYKRQHPEKIKMYAKEKLLPHKQRIEKRDISFFDNNRYIFAELGDDKVNYYRDEIVTRNRIGKEDMEAMWKYLDAMIAAVEALC